MSKTMTASTASKNLWTAILIATLIAGTLDGLSAVVNYAIHGGKDPGKIFKYIAGAALGPSAYTGGTGILLLGILFHYMVAFAWTAFYFLIYRSLPPGKKNWVVSGLLYGVFVYLVMNLGVVPLSRIGKFPASVESVITNLLILMVMIGLTVAWRANRYFEK
jgi:hypothetical protein